MTDYAIKESSILSDRNYLIHVEDTDLTPMTKGRLLRFNIVYLADLVQYTDSNLRGYCDSDIPCGVFGRQTIAQITEMLKMRGLQLGTKIIFCEPKSEFRSRVNKAYLNSTASPEPELLKTTRNALLDRFGMPELVGKIETNPRLQGALRQMIEAQEIFRSECRLTSPQLTKLFNISSALQVLTRR